jgi:hypothetical protein
MISRALALERQERTGLAGSTGRARKWLCPGRPLVRPRDLPQMRHQPRQEKTRINLS